jgi:predicted ATPase
MAVRGTALVEQGQLEEGIAQMQQGVAALQAQGTAMDRFFLTGLVAAYAKVGRIEKGLSLLDNALTHVDKADEHIWKADLYRLKGELTIAQESQKAKVETSPQSPTPNPQVKAEAEACFLKAIEIARKRQAKSQELHATMSLAKLWQQQGKKAEAHKMLADIYNWFTEGFDTKDLQEAKALLEELA